MLDFLFYLFAAMALGSSLLVVLNRNAVNSAMFMILTFVSTAALFFLLEAFFLGVLQILVYAGAVMVLFLFIIMLLDVDQASRRQMDKASVITATVMSAMLAFGVFFLFAPQEFAASEAPLAEVSSEAAAESSVADGTLPGGYGLPLSTESRSYGYALMTKYLLPVQVSGFLLLSALVGVVLISKRLGASGEQENEQPAHIPSKP